MIDIQNFVTESRRDLIYTDSSYEGSGDFKRDPVTKEVTNLNMTLNKKGDGSVGNINAWTADGELKINFNDIPYSEFAGVAEAVHNCITQLKAFNPA